MLHNGETFQLIHGAGGMGKTYLIKKAIEEDPSFAILTASTGIAAINLGGKTINSVLGYFNTNELLQKVASKSILTDLLLISRQYKAIAIDELSMVSGQQLDLLCLAIEMHNAYIESSAKLKAKHHKLKLVTLGDAAQLPPVSKVSYQGAYPDSYEAELERIKNSAAKPFFKAKYWDKFKVHQLTEVKRQTDKEFIDKLMCIREGRVHEVVDWFEEKVGFNETVDENFIGSTFFPTNKQVDKFNKFKLDQLPGEATGFPSERKGKQLMEWKNIPETLYLKPGSKILLLCNNFDLGYANGDLAIVVDMLAQGILVKLLRNERIVLIDYKTLKNTVNYKNQKTGKYFTKTIGTIDYLPVRQGDSSSIHRAQGLTLEYAQVDFRHWFLATLSGGLYTALSRVTSYQGLRLVGSREQFIKACFIHPDCLQFIQQLNSKVTQLV